MMEVSEGGFLKYALMREITRFGYPYPAFTAAISALHGSLYLRNFAIWSLGFGLLLAAFWLLRIKPMEVLARSAWLFLLMAISSVLLTRAGNSENLTPAYQSRLEQFNGGVRSWKELRDRLVVKQRFDMSCGAAALATVLSLYYNEKTDEADIMDIIGLRDEYSFADLAYAAGEMGYKAVPISADFNILAQLKIPVVLFINNFGAGHFTVFKGTDGQNVWLGDPAWGNTHLSKRDFLKRWQTGRSDMAPGQFLVILKPGQVINEAFFGLSNVQVTTFFTLPGLPHTATK
ncbi:putative double-glycine peptidase [Agrobacterium pusense]|uniref:C39 family peptidase n=1 Tax=Agrobacterium pusense TaxID=648995 RepID=UPI00285594A2|nr:cysteine peptidase family C39 domain-containing protein [Agrobacterium pusense]MDR6189624.1 putative double-glycine peptidase [Agrobacterium pusense]